MLNLLSYVKKQLAKKIYDDMKKDENLKNSKKKKDIERFEYLEKISKL